MWIRYALIILLLGSAAYLTYSPRQIEEPEVQPLKTFPKQIGQWTTASDIIFNEPTLKVLKPTDYLMRTYVNRNGDSLGLYVGYHNGGPNAGPIHSPKNCLPGAGWHMEANQEIRVSVGKDAITLVRADFAMGDRKMTCYYWYQVRGEAITKDLSMKLAEFTGVLLANRKDASFIRIDVTNAGHQHADALAADFLQDAYPLLLQYLPS